jgi:hypothetical protein
LILLNETGGALSIYTCMSHGTQPRSLRRKNAQHWQEPSRRWQSAKQCRNGSPFSPMPKPPLGEWYRRTLAQARSTRFRHKGTSQHYGERDRASPSRFGGAPPTRMSPETRKPTSGRSLQQDPRTHVGWNCSQGLLRTSSERSRRRNGQKPASGLGAGSQ